MAFNNSGMVLYYLQPKFYTHARRHKHRHTHTRTRTEIDKKNKRARRKALFISVVFLGKFRMNMVAN